MLCSTAQKIRNLNFSGVELATNRWHRFMNLENGVFFFIWITSTVKNVKPCGRTTRFSSGLHCQAQKGRRTVVDGGGARGISRLALELCQVSTYYCTRDLGGHWHLQFPFPLTGSMFCELVFVFGRENLRT